MLLSLREWRARSAERAAVASALKARLAPLLDLGPEDAISAQEVACPDPDCPDAETVVLVMRAGERTRALKLARPMAGVTDDDLAALVAEERARRTAGAE